MPAALHSNLVFSCFEQKPWQLVDSTTGAILGDVAGTPIDPFPPGCFGMGRFADDRPIREARDRIPAGERGGGAERTKTVAHAVERGPMALESSGERPVPSVDQVSGALPRGPEVRCRTHQRAGFGGELATPLSCASEERAGCAISQAVEDGR